MPKGPQGQKRPADVVSNAVHIARIAIGEETEELTPKETAQELGAKGGRKRAENMSPKRRAEIASKAAKARWQKPS